VKNINFINSLSSGSATKLSTAASMLLQIVCVQPCMARLVLDVKIMAWPLLQHHW